MCILKDFFNFFCNWFCIIIQIYGSVYAALVNFANDCMPCHLFVAGLISKLIKMQILPLMLLIPCVTGVFWLLAYLVFSPRDVYFRKLKRFIALISLFFLFAYLSSNTDSGMIIHYALFKQVCALALVPSLISFIKSYRNIVPDGPLFKFCSFLPWLHLVMGIESVYIAGYENAVRIFLDSMDFVGPMFPFLEDKGQIVFYACYTYVFRTDLLINFFLLALNLMSCFIKRECSPKETFAFLFARHRSNLAPVQYLLSLIIFLIIMPATLLGKTSYLGNVFIMAAACIIIAVSLSVMAIIGAAGPMDKHSLPGILADIRKSGRKI